jgi:hypothetical protein
VTLSALRFLLSLSLVVFQVTFLSPVGLVSRGVSATIAPPHERVKYSLFILNSSFSTESFYYIPPLDGQDGQAEISGTG